MPRVRSQYIAEMRERFEVVDRVKASAEEKASLTKAIQEDEVSSPEVSPSKENTLKVSSRYSIHSLRILIPNMTAVDLFVKTKALFKKKKKNIYSRIIFSERFVMFEAF